MSSKITFQFEVLVNGKWKSNSFTLHNNSHRSGEVLKEMRAQSDVRNINYFRG